MADIASPIAICLAGGITAACVQSLAPDLAAWGVSGPSILWGGVGAYAGDMLRLMQAQDAGKAYTRMTRGMLFVSGAVGAVGGPWASQVAAGGGLLATCGCSVIVGATWHWLLQQVLQRVINRIGGATNQAPAVKGTICVSSPTAVANALGFEFFAETLT